VFILEDFFAAIGDFLYSLFDSLLTNSSIKSRKKQEKKLGESKNFKVYRTKTEQIFFLIFMLAILTVIVFIAFLPDIALTSLLITEGIIAVFALLLLLGYLNAKFNYYVISEENIVHHRLFGKNNTIEYSDIFYIVYTVKGNSLAAYNKYGTRLFYLENTQIGIERLTDILEEKGIRHENSELITEEIKKSDEYQLKQRKNSRIVKIILAIIALSIIAIILFSIWAENHGI
jgi:hypothetical protein